MTTQQRLIHWRTRCRKWAQARRNNDPLTMEPQMEEWGADSPYVRTLARQIKDEELKHTDP